MKPKKNAFSNSSTGYSRNHYKQQNQQQNKTAKSDLNAKTDEKKLTKEDKIENALEDDKNLNSGFGDYLRTPEAVEMMKLFVFANTIMLILTMAWPNVREQYYWLRHWLASLEF